MVALRACRSMVLPLLVTSVQDLLILNQLLDKRPSPGLEPQKVDFNMEDIGATTHFTCTNRQEIKVPFDFVIGI